MPDVIIPITDAAHHIEVRADNVINRNNLRASGSPGTPGKFTVVIDTVNEYQRADNSPIRQERRPSLEFDPMDYATVEIPGTGRTLAAIMSDYLAAVDFFKGGLPPQNQEQP